MTYVWLGVLGVALGAVGTLVGAGGGFLLVPLLVLMYPAETPDTITAISLTVVMFNALSGSFSYWRQRKVDVRSALWFSAAAIPGAIGGVFVSGVLPGWLFRLVLGAVLLAVSVALLVRKVPAHAGAHSADAHSAVAHSAPSADPREQAPDRWGPSFAERRGLGMVIALGVGFCSSLLGIGGGIIHVPVLVHVLDFPVHVATATSHAVLAMTSVAGVATHIATGAFHAGIRRAAAISVGVVVGAQLGAAAAPRVPAGVIMKVLAVCLLAVSVRVLWLGWDGWMAAGTPA